jgi:hypothetical protein
MRSRLSKAANDSSRLWTAWARGWERRHQLRDDWMIFAWINSIALNMFLCLQEILNGLN